MRYYAITPTRQRAVGPRAGEVEGKLQAWAGETAREIAKYPPPMGQRYVRTGRLGRGWRTAFRHIGRGLEASVVNAVPYSGRVQGPEQDAMFRDYKWSRIDRVAAAQWRKHGRGIGVIFGVR